MKHVASLIVPSQSPLLLDLRRDHDHVRHLLDAFITGATMIGRRDMMRLATDLFEVHSALEAEFFITEVGGRSYEAIMGMMEQLELTNPASQLYTARGIELKGVLEAYMAAEERTGLIPWPRFQGRGEHSDLLARRRKLLAESQCVLCTF
jgi:hypothetical protein